MDEITPQKPDQNVDKESLKVPEKPVVKNDMDLNSIMQMATNLLKNDTLLNSVMGLGNVKQSPAPAKPSGKAEDIDLVFLSRKLDNLAFDILQLKKDMKKIKEFLAKEKE